MIILLCILAHLIGDFLLQSNVMAANKRKYFALHLFHHALVLSFVFLVDVFLFSSVAYTEWLIIISGILMSHAIIDMLKIVYLNYAQAAPQRVTKLWIVFIVDQMLHGLAIVLMGILVLGYSLPNSLKQFLSALTTQQGGSVTVTTTNQWLLLFIFTLLVTVVAGHFIAIFLGPVPLVLEWTDARSTVKLKPGARGGISAEHEMGFNYARSIANSNGKYIGYIERLLILIFVFQGQYGAIGFIIAAKSLARFKQMDDRGWAEYFLLGTLTSIFISISIGILMKQLFYAFH
ncbi:MAG: DUF3307 domain-containing protein [Bacilli bacterium]